jgi:putative adenylate-forming enzyme
MDTLAVDQQDQQSLDDFSAYLPRESWRRQQLDDYQARALRACRDYAYTYSPFYQRFHHGLFDRPLQELPVLTKAMMMEHFDELVTDRDIRFRDVQQYLTGGDLSTRFLDRYQVTATSGSTGQPGIYLYNRAEGAVRAKSFLRSSSWGGVTLKSRVAAVTSVVPILLDGQRMTGLHLAAADPLETLVERLNEWQPDVLLGYSSITSVLANEQRAGRLQIAPRSIFCAADTLTSDMRRRIEETWQTRLFRAYGTSEGGVLASECSFHQGMHLFEDFSIVEVVDQHNRPVPPGEQGDKVLVTVLFRRTQPLIRCEVSDLVRTSTIERCPCGRPFILIDALQGRTIEVLYLQSPTGKEEAVSPYLFESTFNVMPVGGWQVVHEPHGLDIFLIGASAELRDEQLLDALRQMLTTRGVIVPPISIRRVQALTKNASGKTLTVISRVPRRTA